MVGGYADSLVYEDGRHSTIDAFRRFLASMYGPGVGVHLLPVCPSAGDSGFAPNDWCGVRPELGAWKDVRTLASERPVMLDGIYNHVGIGHRWVEASLERPGPADDVLYLFNGEIHPSQAPSSPRGESVLRSYMRAGELIHMWQTFSSAAVDVRLDRPEVLDEVVRHMDTLVAHRVWGVRLDAVAYYGKSLKGPVRHVNGVHDLASTIGRMAAARGLDVTAQLDIDQDGSRYFSAPEETGYAMNDFGYAEALACSIATGDARHVGAHVAKLARLERRVIRSPRTHDGLLLRSKLVDSETRHRLLTRCAEVGLTVRMEGGSPYEVNEPGPLLYSSLRPEADTAAMVELAIAVTGVVADRGYFYLPFVLACTPPMLARLVKRDPRLPNRTPIGSRDLNRFERNGARIRHSQLVEVLQYSHNRRSRPRANRASILEVKDGLLHAATHDGTLQLVANFGAATVELPSALRRTVAATSTSESRGRLTPLSYSLFLDDSQPDQSPDRSGLSN